MKRCLEIEVFRLQQYFQIVVGKLIARLVLSIIFVVFLNRIVCQVSVDIARIVVELFATSAQVPFLVPISLQMATIRSDQRIAADIKFSILVKEGIDVLLNERAFAVGCQLFDGFEDAIPADLHGDALAPVGILSWFDDPHLFIGANVLGEGSG